MKRITIAIDGYTGTGKGTTSKGVAKILGYTYLDTGAMYRAATLYAMRNNLLDVSDEEKTSILDRITLHFELNTETGVQEMYLDGENVEKEIRETSLGLQMRPIVSCIPLRKKMIALQAFMGKEGGIIGDGRDMGTHVFPSAEVKVFLICDVDERVKRRVKQLTEQGQRVDAGKIREEIVMRDDTDYLGPKAVNKKAYDAIVIDTTDTTIDEQIAMIVSLAKEKIQDL